MKVLKTNIIMAEGRRIFIPRFRNVKEKDPAFCVAIIMEEMHPGAVTKTDGIGVDLKEAMTSPVNGG